MSDADSTIYMAQKGLFYLSFLFFVRTIHKYHLNIKRSEPDVREIT